MAIKAIKVKIMVAIKTKATRVSNKTKFTWVNRIKVIKAAATRAAVIKVAVIRVVVDVATKVTAAAMKDAAPTVNATSPSIAGLMAAVDILATIATPSSTGTRTMPLSRIEWAAAQEIVSPDMLGPRKKII
jgi:protein-S-isoprenylcysteine O-methyltransferase Ste14